MLPFLYNYPYLGVIGVALQIICVVHCLRRGLTQQWLWVIIVLPVVGSIAYMYSVMYNRRSSFGLTSGLGAIFSPGVSIRRLESNLRFSDTFNNRIALADAYMANGRSSEAIELYESSRNGAFEENEHVVLQLIAAYFQQKQYDKLIPLARMIYNRPQFARSRAHIYYAISLGYVGDAAGAEAEFRKMKSRFSNFEARYQYGLFLRQAGRNEDARTVFGEMIEESRHLSARENRDARPWVAQARMALKES